MNITLAKHHGMCFGVRQALRSTHDAAKRGPVTLLGQLVHNPLVDAHLRTLGVQQGTLDSPGSAPTREVIISAHGASDRDRSAWKDIGHQVTDTTCPLVRKAHDALATLVEGGYFPVVIGQATHVEVRGLVGDFPHAQVVLEDSDLDHLPHHRRYGVISQTTQPLLRVLHLVEALKQQHPQSEVRFVDTVCHPTKQRQSALEDLCGQCQVIIVVGGRNSNNTRQLTEAARQLGCTAHQIERPSEIDPAWFSRGQEVGVTAGTSTLDETVREVVDRLKSIAAELPQPGLFHSLLKQKS
ncbi:4-hydroxy-3-methylbut-2-enyl diphosphate reductase [Verrucomicrobium sp. BvORR034]|uniref:4-hydroxy-3-methylbut-2-enyl diphosphate reductase n=1 Tax=Verrucomicrobium sp. BvORR034 TaxID=1396418 RepID=UPI0006789375|nr:4-hydroxy-3-methylbut-2-enyl diphosphate reductase [Verrucomicrobium sp. BvORR034]